MPGIEHHTPGALISLLTVLFDHPTPDQTFPALKFVEKATIGNMFAIHFSSPIFNHFKALMVNSCGSVQQHSHILLIQHSSPETGPLFNGHKTPMKKQLRFFSRKLQLL
jgi:hypothetical protein